MIDASKVELYYGIFILFTATGFLLFGATGKIDFKSKGVSVLPVISCMITVGMFCGVNTPIIVIIGAACSLLSMGYLGGRIMYRMSVSYSEIKYQGTVVGVSMAAAILLQYVIQTLIQTKLISVICFEIILAALFIFEVKHNIVPLTDDEKDKEGTKILERKNIWVYVFATILMTMILSLNDAYLVDLSANTNTVNLFSWVRLFYCLSLVLAGLIYDFKNAAYFNIFVACAMMLSTVAYAFMGNNADFNIDMSIMYNIALFVSLNKPHSRLTESGVELRLREMGKKLGVEKVHPHKFRRTMATRAIEKGRMTSGGRQLCADRSEAETAD